MDINSKFNHQGDIVLVSDSVYGSYIGKFVATHEILSGAVKIQILACTVYPSQLTIFSPATIYERHPFEFGIIKTFDARDMKRYTGSIPCYFDSVKSALSNAISEAREQGNVNIAAKLRNHMLYIA